MRIRRRQFLRGLGAGGVVVTAPAFLAGCGVLPAIDVSEPPPANPFLDWFGLGEGELRRVLAALGAAGGDFGEVYLQHARLRHIRREDGMPHEDQVTIEQGAGLRVVHDGRSGFAHTENLELESLTGAASEAAARGDGLPLAGHERLAGMPLPDRYPVVTPWSDVADAARERIMTRLERAARSADPAVTRVAIEWRDSDERIVIATLDGRLATDRRPLTSLSLQVTLTRGTESHSGFANLSARDGIGWYTDARVDELAASAVGRARMRFDARRPPAGELPVVLAAGTAGILLLETAGHALEGDFATSGDSAYSGRLGETVAAQGVTLVDDATLPHARGSLNVDDEGSATGRTTVLSDGVLRGFLHDARSAARAGAATTGSARRESFRHAPLPRMSNLLLADGTATPEELEREIALGLVAETFSAGRADPAGGDFTFRVRNGWLIEKGRRTMPVRDVELRGTGAGLLAGISGVANDGRLDEGAWTCGKHGQALPVAPGGPTARVGSLTVVPPAGNA